MPLFDGGAVVVSRPPWSAFFVVVAFWSRVVVHEAAATLSVIFI